MRIRPEVFLSATAQCCEIFHKFFLFGQVLHHVEGNNSPAHIHNEVENALFVPMLRYGQLKNTHVVASMLRFLNYPRLALKQTEHFHQGPKGSE